MKPSIHVNGWMLAAAAALALPLLGQGDGAPGQGDLIVEPVQGNVYVIAGAGGNVVVQTGKMGLLVVDTGLSQNSDKLLAAIRKISGAPVQYIINTHLHADHTGGNVRLRSAGETMTGGELARRIGDSDQGAQIVAHLSLLNRMGAPTGKAAAAPERAWPTITYVSGHKDLFFNGESVVIAHQPHAHTDGDSLVYFRRSDVIAAGDVYLTTSYPLIDLSNGGSIGGEIDALNNILDLAIPEHEQEGGTYIVPGHGRISDEADVLDYRDMVTIIRDRVQDAIRRGLTLEQTKEAGLTKDYDPRYGRAAQGITGRDFVEAVYLSLTSGKTGKGK